MGFSEIVFKVNCVKDMFETPMPQRYYIINHLS